jgi:hypothetical protein
VAGPGVERLKGKHRSFLGNWSCIPNHWLLYGSRIIHNLNVVVLKTCEARRVRPLFLPVIGGCPASALTRAGGN